MLSIVRTLRLHKSHRIEPAWTPEPSIQRHCARSMDSHSKGVFGPILKLTFMMISFALFRVPMGLLDSLSIATDATTTTMLPQDHEFIFRFLFYSFPTIESHRQHVAHHGAHRTLLRQPLEASDGAREEQKIFPAPAATTPQPSPATAAKSRVGRAEKPSGESTKIRILSVRQRGERSRRGHRR